MTESYHKYYEPYENEIQLKNMYFGIDNKIKLIDIYSEVDKLKNDKDTKIINWNNKYNLMVQKKAESFSFFLDIVKKENNELVYSKELYINPIKIYMLNEEIIDIVSVQQFTKLYIKNKKKEIYLFCKKENKTERFMIINLLNHLNCKDKIYAFMEGKETPVQEVDFDKRFKKFPRSNKFISPYEFDLHYSDYFEFYKYYEINSEFKYIKDKSMNREKFINCLNNIYPNTINIFFGKGGIGKSITLIQVFKYDYDHSIYGTLYINCKCISKAFKNNIKIMKNILKDEITFLFKDEYDLYLKCVDMIEEYMPKKFSTYWEIILNIIDLCQNENKQYFLIFDQYKDKIDTDGELFKLNEKLKTKNIFSIIVCCSLNDKDIRYYKIQKLFGSANLKNNPDNMIIYEITSLLHDLDLSIDNGGEYDKAFKMLGKNVKNHIALSEIYSNYPGQLQEFLETKKKKIKDNLLDFYKVDNIKDNELIYISNIFKFSTGTEYELNYLYKIQEYIPFKYFDVIKSEKNENLAEIVYNFDLVKDALSEIYELLIFENLSIYKIFNNNGLLDEGALGGLFEKFVIYNMTPKKDEKIIKLFGKFKINTVYEVKKFLPKSNEKWKKKVYVKDNLNPGMYLFKQKNFNGKGFDAAIIIINDVNEATVYLFQISINKKEIYSEKNLEKMIEIFIQYFSQLFTFELSKEKVYFTYIFDIQHKENLLKKCDEKNMKCIFFKSSIKIFTDRNEMNVEEIDIEDNFVHFGKKFFGKDIEMKNEIYIPSQHIFFNKCQYNNLIDFLKNKFQKYNNINIIFIKTIDKFSEIYSFKEAIILRNIAKEDINSWKDCIKGGSNKYNKIIQQTLIDKNIKVKGEEKNNNLKKDEKKFKLIIIKNKILEFYLLFPNGEIVFITKLLLKSDGKVTYDIFYIE